MDMNFGMRDENRKLLDRVAAMVRDEIMPLEAEYQAMSFAPAPLTLQPGDGPPHIRLDRAAQFLIGDRL